ncbi:MAG TPA: signal peptidase I [Caulobacteraceae bacterium]|jgi:signal peptidase I|nr:signal peptidase I [Caulobacteraceae bacterium]
MTVAPPESAAEPVSAEAKPKGPIHELFELAKTIVYALLIALVLRVALFQPFTIPSASMEPTLLVGDYIIVSKFAYGWSRHSFPLSPPLFKGRVMERTPHRGDIVVFKTPRDNHTDFIKRLVGLPGDRIQVTQGALSINGVPVKREKLTPIQEDSAFGVPHDVDRYRETLPDTGKTFVTYSFGPDGEADNTVTYTVPPGHYFMMGDNRDNSLDSRFTTEQGGVGFVPAENLVGRAEIILFSWKPGASLIKPWTWVTAAQPQRFGERLQ